MSSEGTLRQMNDVCLASRRRSFRGMGCQKRGENSRRDNDAVLGEEPAHFGKRAGDTLAGRFFGQTQRRADFNEAGTLEEAQQDAFAFALFERCQRLVQERLDLRPLRLL